MNRRSGGTSTRSGYCLLKACMGRGQPVLEQIGHGHQLDRPAGDLEGVDRGAAAAPAAADQGQPDGIVLGGVHVGNGHSGQCRGCRQFSAAPEEFPPRCLLPRSSEKGAMLFHGCPLVSGRGMVGLDNGRAALASCHRGRIPSPVSLRPRQRHSKRRQRKRAIKPLVVGNVARE